MGNTEQVIQEAYEAFRRGDIDGVLARWHDAGVLRPLVGGRTYRGHDELRLFLERDIYERDEFDFRVYTILEQADNALVFGRYSVNQDEKVIEKGIFWIAQVEERRIKSYEAFENVGDAMASFKERLGLTWS